MTLLLDTHALLWFFLDDPKLSSIARQAISSTESRVLVSPARSLSDLGVRREGKRDRDQNLCKFEANSGLFNEDLRKFWPISAFPQQNHPKSDRLLVCGRSPSRSASANTSFLNLSRIS
uniref:PIN domain-containing protein n=1 Tax=Candidatus Kentrum sp. DK TaxID=2126562 RepID=A0A450S9Y6_9GAMM|nr:MAG: hypothetical protein BECKDK2373C_GA0170839_10239 [Candidatus Kentron sp. DK]